MTARSMTLRSRLPTGEIVVPAVLGIGLGLAAYIPDTLDDSAAPYLNPFFSSGFAWGFIALLAGYLTRREMASIAAGAATLMTAAIIYYCITLFVSQRCSVDALNIPAFWAVGAVIGGGLMGWLGWATRDTSKRRTSEILGVVLGLLTGEGLFAVIYFGFVYLGPADAFYLSKLIPAIVQVMLGIITVVLMAAVRKRQIGWRRMGAAGAISIVANVVLWYGLFAVRMGL